MSAHRITIVVLASVIPIGRPASVRGTQVTFEADATISEPVMRRIEVMTVTDTMAAITWETAQPEDGIVRFGTKRDRLDHIASEAGGPRRFHQCRLTGLQPGTKYYFVCQRADESGEAPANQSFTTLTPPPGRELFAFATLTDTHFGREIVGRVTLAGGRIEFPGVSWREPQVPLWQVAIEPAIGEINSAMCAFTIVKGDVTHGLDASEFRIARDVLGQLTAPCYVVRGNHDRPEQLIRTFGLQHPWYSFDHEGYHFVILDTEPLLGGPNQAREDQVRWLAEDLQKHREMWTFVFLHRPIQPVLARSSDDALSNHAIKAGSSLLQKMGGRSAARALKFATGRLQDVPEPQARRLAQLFSEHGRVAGVFAGHVHRNFVGYWAAQTGNLPYVETASASDYPCGYAITRVFTGGYMHNFCIPDDARCLEWSAITRETFERMALAGKAGTLADRNFVVRFDRLDLQPKPTE
ncbi:MAG TPA: metallophosphoesterase family protein [Phycisphaerae bacterium]|nr:metallophosphoesterase family protein [Phycisphaerae bacterium]